MANLLESIGRQRGGLTRATQNLFQSALALRSSNRSADLEERKFERASEIHGLDVDLRKEQINAAKFKAEGLRKNEAFLDRPVEVSVLEKAMNNPGQWQKDYNYAKSIGIVDTLSDGKTEVMTIRNLQKFRDTVANTHAYQQSFNTENLKRYTTEVENLQGQINAIEAEYLEKGKTAEDAAKDKRMAALVPQLQVAAKGKQSAIFNDKNLAGVIEKMVTAGYPMKEINDWIATGDTEGLTVSAKTKSTDFEKAYKQYTAIPGNANVTRVDFKQIWTPKAPAGELTDTAVIKHFDERVWTGNVEKDLKASAELQRKYIEFRKEGLRRNEAMLKADEYYLSKPDIDDTDIDYTNLWE